MYKHMGILYLIQPAELIGTNHYKIGYSSKSTLERINTGYKKGSRYLHILECDNAFDIEKILKYEFSKKFELIAGKEFFKGDENEMLKLFYNIYITNKNISSHTEEKFQEKSDKEYDCDDEEDEGDEEDEDEEMIEDDEDDEENVEHSHYETDFENCSENHNKNQTTFNSDSESIHEVKKKYVCEYCDYKSNNLTNYNKHLMSRKHKKQQMLPQNNNTQKDYICVCGNIYKHKSSYYRHKKVCEHKVEEKQDKQEEETNEKVDYKEMFNQMLNQNRELQDLLIKQQQETNKNFEILVLQIKSIESN
jgi:hypothetical protein